MAGAAGEESLCEPRALGRRLPGVPRPVDALPDRLLFDVPLEATRLHPALDSAAHHPDGRLSQPPASGGEGYPPMAAGAACVARRHHGDTGTVAAVVDL